jgi:hypothetical protein
MSDPDAQGFNPHDSEYTPSKPRPRKPERADQPRASQRDDIDAAMRQIVDDIIARDAKRFPREREQARRREEQ